MRRGVPHGDSSLYLASGVSFLNEEEAVFDAMLDGWAMQQIGGRNLRKNTVDRVVGTVRQFQRFTGEWPWQWNAGALDEWMTHLVGVLRREPSTIRVYQQAVRGFCDYICSEHYGWVQECEARFGTHPVQVCHEWNTVTHLQDYEGRPGRRALTRPELQGFLDHADNEVELRLSARRKGALPAYRDATLFKVMYGWGLRPVEVANLDTCDFYRNAHAPEFGSFGMLQVRHGKASRGGAPKRRSVVTVWGWAVSAVEDYIANVRPLLRSEGTNALWLTERGRRMRTREVAERFAQYRHALSLDPAPPTFTAHQPPADHLGSSCQPAPGTDTGDRPAHLGPRDGRIPCHAEPK